MSCKNTINLGQSGNVPCGTVWGEPMLCDKCKGYKEAKDKYLGIIESILRCSIEGEANAFIDYVDEKHKDEITAIANRIHKDIWG